jgi:hypothetical protein
MRMTSRSKRYLRLLIGSALYIGVGFLIDDEFGVFYFASALFWVVVTLLVGGLRDRKKLRLENSGVPSH